jgi:hypothetical protein
MEGETRRRNKERNGGKKWRERGRKDRGKRQSETQKTKDIGEETEGDIFKNIE